MIDRLFRGTKPHRPFAYRNDSPLRLDEARLDAWALALGQTRRATDPPDRRPHRGQLPDIDASCIVAAPRRPSLVVRLWSAVAAAAWILRGERAKGLPGHLPAAEPARLRLVVATGPAAGAARTVTSKDRSRAA